MSTSNALLTDPNTMQNDPLASEKKRLINMSQHLEIPVLFKRQKAWQHVSDHNVNLIKSSINKCDMPSHSLVVWVESNLPVWRYTGGKTIPNNSGYAMFTRHLELQQCSHMLYINGSDLNGNLGTLRMLIDLMICTYPIIKGVYNIDVSNMKPVHSII